MKQKVCSIMVLFLVFLSMICVVSSGWSAVAAEESWQEVVREYYRGNYENVRELAEEYNDDNIISFEDYKVYEYLVKAEIALVNIDRAEKFISFLEEQGYYSGELYWKIGRLYLNREGQFDSALFDRARNYLQKARKYGFYGVQQQRDLSLAYMGLEEYERVIEILEELTARAPEARHNLTLGRAYKKTERLQEAVEAYKKVLEQEAGNGGVFLELGELYTELGEQRQALLVYEWGLNRNPNNIGLKRATAEKKLEIGQLNEAEKLYLEIIDSHPHIFEAHYKLGRVYEQKELLLEAVKSYRAAVRYNKNYIAPRLALSELFIELEEYEQALFYVEEVIDIDPGSATAYYLRGQLHFLQEEYEHALEDARSALHRNPDLEEAVELKEMLLEKMANN